MISYFNSQNFFRQCIPPVVHKTPQTFRIQHAFLVRFIPLVMLPIQVFAEVGVDPRIILLGTHQPLSGPQKSFSEIGRGASVFFHYLNDQGGIHGRRVTLLQRDDRFQPKQTLEVVTNLIMRERIFSLFYSGIKPVSLIFI